jgi:2-iminobutanoate/2-iminopropanoate deaminase
MTVRRVNVDGVLRLNAFSHATIAGDTVYVAGTIGSTGAGLDLAEGGVGPQTTQTLRNIERILAACGATWSDVVKVNVSLADMADFGAMNEAYLAVLGEDVPARITVGGVSLAIGAAIEVDCIAYLGG